MRNRIKQHHEIGKKESTEEEGIQELAQGLSRADDDGFALSGKNRGIPLLIS